MVVCYMESLFALIMQCTSFLHGVNIAISAFRFLQFFKGFLLLVWCKVFDLPNKQVLQSVLVEIVLNFPFGMQPVSEMEKG